MKTQQFTPKPFQWTILLAMIFVSTFVQAQEVEITEETDTNKVKKVYEGKRIKLIIATKENGKDESKEFIIELPESLSEEDAESIEEALEEAGEAMEEALEEVAEAVGDKEKTIRELEEKKIIISDDKISMPGLSIEVKNNKKPKLVETSWHVMELGLNEMLTPNGADLPAEYADMKIIPAKSVNFNWGIVQQGINLAQGKLRLVYGLGIEFNNYRFKEDIDLVEGSDVLSYTVNGDVDYKKNKLVTQYLTMPLMLNFKSNPKNENKSLNLAAGVQGGYLIQSHQKQKWQENGSKEKRKIRGDYHVNQYRLGYAIQFGYGDVNFYAKYYPEPIFKTDKGPEAYSASVGLVLFPF